MMTSWSDRLMPSPVSRATIATAGWLFTTWYRSRSGTPSASTTAACAVSSSALISPDSRPSMTSKYSRGMAFLPGPHDRWWRGASRTAPSALLGPGVALDDLDEIGTDETGHEMHEDVGVDRAEGGIRALLEAVGECGQDLSLEVRPRVRADHGVDEGAIEVGVADAEHVGFHAGGDQSDLGLQVVRGFRGGVQRDAQPGKANAVLGQAVRGEESAGPRPAPALPTRVGGPGFFRGGAGVGQPA